MQRKELPYLSISAAGTLVFAMSFVFFLLALLVITSPSDLSLLTNESMSLDLAPSFMARPVLLWHE